MARRNFGTVRKLASGRWQVRYPGPDNRLRAAPSTFASKTQALQFLATVEADLLRGDWRDSRQSVRTVSDWGTQFLRDQRPRLTPKTFALYESLFRSCVVEAFGAVPLNLVRKSAVREWVAALSARGLSASRVRQALGLLSQILDAAVDDELVDVNPCRGVRARAFRSRIRGSSRRNRSPGSARPCDHPSAFWWSCWPMEGCASVRRSPSAAAVWNSPSAASSSASR